MSEMVANGLVADTPAARAEQLLQRVMGDEQFRRFRAEGYLDLPSRLRPGRTYRLDTAGNLSYRDPGEPGFMTSLCVQPVQPVPRDDQVAMRYLLVTSDEKELLNVANPIAFGFISLVRAIYHDCRQNEPGWKAALYTFSLVGLFLGALAWEIYALVFLLGRLPVVAILSGIILALPALVGLVLVGAALVELVTFLVSMPLRLRLAMRRRHGH